MNAPILGRFEALVALLFRALLCWLLLCSTPAWAEVYQWKDASGHLHFSDQPHQGATQRHVQPLTSVSNPTFNLAQNVLRVPYRQQHGAMMVQVKVNHVMMDFIIDTGATYMVLSPSMAKKAGVHVDATTPHIVLQTANGLAKVSQVWLSKVSLGGWRQQHVKAAIQVISKQHDVGLLGMSFLGHYRMSLDHEHHVMILKR